jgi:agmatine deiminase
MPAEWEPHDRTWMAFPPANDTFGSDGSDTLARARNAWVRVAQVIARYEPVTVLADPADTEAAAALLGGGIAVEPVPLDDAWLRDSGPTFVQGQDGAVAGVDWVFNGWGAQHWAAWSRDRHVGRAVADLAGVQVLGSGLVNEGGGFHVDGRGTVLLTETVQLDPGRNPGATRESVETEIHARLGTRHAVWLPRGLTRDYGEFGTRGHVDIVAAFTPAGSLLVHRQDDPGHPDHEVTREIRGVLASSTDADGRPLPIIDVPAPTVTHDDDGIVDWSYLNHYVANDVVVLCAFDDPNDAVAAGILQDAYPGRTVELVDARDIFAFGGGIHCITQQQPAPRRADGGL